MVIGHVTHYPAFQSYQVYTFVMEHCHIYSVVCAWKLQLCVHGSLLDPIMGESHAADIEFDHLIEFMHPYNWQISQKHNLKPSLMMVLSLVAVYSAPT